MPMQAPRRNALTPDALQMMDIIARTGSFAAAARELGRVPSALTYSVRQLEDALDVLLFDRSSRQAQLTAAGQELLDEGRRLLAEMDAVANRVRRVSTGWESELTVAVDDVISRLTVFELVEGFYAQRTPDGQAPGTRLRVRSEVLAGLWEALVSGQADLAIGAMMNTPPQTGIELKPLGEVEFVFAMAPHHPLAQVGEPLSDAQILAHRAVAVADSAQRLSPVTVNLLPGQDVFTVPSMGAKIEALMRCLGVGFVPEPQVREALRLGRLVARRVQRARQPSLFGYAWRSAATPQPRKAPQGLALQWWLQQLDSPATRRALLERHLGLPAEAV
ncbi:LysR substrate-binding domain-containing protein [Pseudaquabacterium pictum]|uniref:LysR family transcriptional regulator n=1 Tax=Pseudaquabacterium pictum TaxID=2315236 RepID=A0A480AQQ4_9BURK|nr:LysR substrate-binding domain-containing protein [Rubrivivax pictus]GCL62617.1 LysR family transcriptional regulator [Rubrivivax pictus]